MADAARPLALESSAIPPRPRRPLPAGTLLTPRVEQMRPSYGRDVQVDKSGEEDQQDCPLAITVAILRPGQEERERPRDCIKHGCHLDHRGGPQNWPLALGTGRLGRLRYDRYGWEVSGDRGQLRVGPRGERLAHSQVEFILGQHALHECGLEGADHLLAVAVRRPHSATTRRACGHLVSRTCHHRHLPHRAQFTAKHNAVALWQPSPQAATSGIGWGWWCRCGRPGCARPGRRVRAGPATSPRLACTGDGVCREARCYKDM